MDEKDKELQELRQAVKAAAEKITELKESNKALRTQNMQMAEALAEKGKAEIDTEQKIKELRRELHDCRNELCLKCGKYENAHLGACDGCRFESGGKWEKL